MPSNLKLNNVPFRHVDPSFYHVLGYLNFLDP